MTLCLFSKNLKKYFFL